jgi:hypothetical protein
MSIYYRNHMMRARRADTRRAFVSYPNERVFASWVEVLCWQLTDEEFLMEYMLMGAFEKMFGKVLVKGAAVAAEDAEFTRRWPCVSLLMTALRDDAGKVRTVATLTVVCEDGSFKAGLKERDQQLSLWRSGETMQGVLDALETALESGTADWKRSEMKSRK